MEKYVVEVCTIGISKKQTKFLNVTLHDGTSRKVAFVWGISDSAEVTDYLHKVFYCTLKESNGMNSVDLKDVRIGEYSALDANDPLRVVKFETEITVDQTMDMLRAAVKELFNKRQKHLLSFLKVRDLLNMYADYPAALKAHHAIKGGLLEHVYEMLEVYIAISKTSVCANLRHDICIISILFHDYGKTAEYDVQKWDYAEDMPMFAHIYTSAHTLHCCLTKYNDILKSDTEFSEKDREENIIPERDINMLVHAILAHHSKLEWGSPVVPCTKEAEIVHLVDMISGKGNMFENSTNMEKNFFLGTNVIKA
jgi:3'-5' exoribonuclease